MEDFGDSGSIGTRGFARSLAARTVVLGAIWIALLAATCVVGYFVVGPSGLGPVRGLDVSVAHFFMNHRPPGAVGFSRIVPTLALIGLVVVVGLSVVGERIDRLRSAVPSGVTLVVAAAGAYALSSVVKLIFTRPRPSSTYAAVVGHGFSFPSVHATVGLAVLVALAVIVLRLSDRAPRGAIIWGTAILAILIPGSRVVLGLHWISDVTIGALVGAVWGYASAELCLRPLPVVIRHRLAYPVRIGLAVAGSSLVLLLSPVAWSYAQALRAPGSADAGTRTTDWARREGAGGVVDWMENFRYAHPPDAHLTAAAVAHPFASSGSLRSTAYGPAPVRVPKGFDDTGGGGQGVGAFFDGRWVAVDDPRFASDPAVYTADWRPDPAVPNAYVVGVWLNGRRLTAQLVAGVAEPGGSGWPWGGRIPPTMYARMVAAFNGGFRFQDSHGGFMANRRIGVPLQVGAASFIVRRNGTMDVRAWTAAQATDPDIISVRQSLKLIVDGGYPAPGLDANADGSWGSARNQFQYTWRSAIGVDRRGNLVYVAGPGLDLRMLADALVQAGAVRGMQLDIHPGIVTFDLYEPSSGSIVARKLAPHMHKPTDWYFVPVQRDFIAIVTRRSSG